jgi:hypothetical protein
LEAFACYGSLEGARKASLDELLSLPGMTGESRKLLQAALMRGRLHNERG